MKAILCLDLGTTTGAAILKPSGRIESTSKHFKPGKRTGIRFAEFREWLTETKNRCDIEQVFYEDVRNHKGVQAAHIYGGFLAILSAWCEHHGIIYSGIGVGQIKKHISGKGNADKETVIKAVEAKGHHPKDDNEADAIALLYTVLARGGK